jgi:VWFA-related protein
MWAFLKRFGGCAGTFQVRNWRTSAARQMLAAAGESEAMNVRRRVRLTIVAGAVFFLLIGASSSFGQVTYVASAVRKDVLQPQAGQAPAKPATSIEAPVVNLDVLVTDEDGLVLGGLKKENFRVLDEGKPQIITEFESIGAPITIVMLMEYSGIAYDYFAYKASNWGSEFLNFLEPKDYIAVVTYDIKPTVRIDFTRNKAEVQQTLASLSYPQFHEANIYDAIIDTLDRLDHVKGKRAILLISTGADTMGQSTLDDALKRIKASDVTLFSVGVAEAEYQRSQISSGSSLSYLHSKNILGSLARMTGGTARFPRFEGEIPDIFRSVATFLRSQYRIGFSPASAAQDGKYHKLKVEIIAPDGKPLIVANPKGKRQKPRVYAREGYTAAKGNLRD